MTPTRQPPVESVASRSMLQGSRTIPQAAHKLNRRGHVRPAPTQKQRTSTFAHLLLQSRDTRSCSMDHRNPKHLRTAAALGPGVIRS